MTGRISVLHVRSCAFFGSPERLILAQAARLRESCPSEVAVIPDGDVAPFERAVRSSDLAFHLLQKGRGVSVRRVRSLRRLIRERKIDVLCTHDYKSNLIGRLARIGLRIPHLAVFHGRTSHDWRGRVYEAIDNQVLKTVDQVVAVSEATRSALPFLEGKVTVVRNAFESSATPPDRGDARRALDIPASAVVMLTAGRLSVEKGHARLVEVFRRLFEDHRNLYLVVAGDGPERPALEAAIRQAGVNSRTRILGFVHETAPLYAAADFFVLPSDREGLPLVVLEAAAFARPSVATRVGGVGEFIDHGVNGLLVAPTVDALTPAVHRMASDSAFRCAAGAAAQARLAERFSFDRYAREFGELYRDLFRPRTVWITWERHRRTREIADALRAPLIEITSRAHRLVRHPRALLKTFFALARIRPRVLIIQCPSIVLGGFAVLMKPLLRYRLVADCHNAAVSPFAYKARVLLWLVRAIHRGSDLTIVTNETLAEIVRRNGGRPFVLPDPIPPFSALPFNLNGSVKRAVFICSFAADEPYGDLIQAAGLLAGEVELVVTGNAKKANPDVLKSIPENVRLTGFLDEPDYIELLRNADVIVDLTEMENCLVCGAYEAVAAERPLVTSDTAALRAHFRAGTVYARHKTTDLANALRQAMENASGLAAEMRTLRRELESDWDARRLALVARLYGGARDNDV